MSLQSSIVYSISLQSGSNQGAIIATADSNGIVGIYDIRQSISREF